MVDSSSACLRVTLAMALALVLVLVLVGSRFNHWRRGVGPRYVPASAQRDVKA